MQKTSTPTQAPTPATHVLAPSKKTIAMIRQFARIYMPVTNMPGVVLN